MGKTLEALLEELADAKSATEAASRMHIAAKASELALARDIAVIVAGNAGVHVGDIVEYKSSNISRWRVHSIDRPRWIADGKCFRANLVGIKKNGKDSLLITTISSNYFKSSDPQNKPPLAVVVGEREKDSK